MSEGSAQIRILAVDDHVLVQAGHICTYRYGARYDSGGRGIEWARGNPTVPCASPGHHAHGPANAGDERPRCHHRDSGEFPDAKIIVLTTYKGDVQILRALKAGARGYLLKSTIHKELLDTIRAVHAGKKALSPEASYEIAEHATDDALTPAEINVLRLIAAGNANKQIADQLSITEETVKGRVKNILSKLGANDRTQAAMIGLKRGIIEL